MATLITLVTLLNDYPALVTLQIIFKGVVYRLVTLVTLVTLVALVTLVTLVPDYSNVRLYNPHARVVVTLVTLVTIIPSEEWYLPRVMCS